MGSLVHQIVVVEVVAQVLLEVMLLVLLVVLLVAQVERVKHLLLQGHL
jgi:hypothetical protein